MNSEASVFHAAAYPIEVQDLTVLRGRHVIVKDVSLVLKKGTFMALVGPSGCGKTSLLRVLSLLDQKAAGSILFWGQAPELSNGNIYLGKARFYPRATYVPQTLALWPHMTLRENLLFATTKSALVQDHLEKLCQELDVLSILDQKPAVVSQGQRQRCALVRALLLNPAILLLDEITAALDEGLAKKVWTLLRSFVEDGGSILASTHSGRLASACDCCLRIRESALFFERPVGNMYSGC